MARLKRDDKGLRVKIGICKTCNIPKKRLNHYGACQDCRNEAAETRQVAYKKAVHELYAIVGGSDRVERLRAQGYSFRFQAAQIGNKITPADLSRWVAGKEPKELKKRRALGLPIVASVPVCAACDEVHIGACPKDDKPKRPRDPRTRHRISVSPATKSAVRTLAAKYGVTEGRFVAAMLEFWEEERRRW